LLLASIGLPGCSQEEELKLDPGVSPFYPGVSATEGASTKADAGQPVGSKTKLEAAVPGEPIRPEDVEKQLRVALRAVQKGEKAKAGLLLDQILDVEPLNREALAGRGIVALEQFMAASSLPDQDAAISRAAEVARVLHRTQEAPKKREIDIYARALTGEAKVRALQGKNDRALAILKEATDAGLEAYAWAEQDKDMAPLRSSPQFQAAVKAYHDSRLALARQRIQKYVEKPLGFPFDFKLLNLDDKPVSLADFRGKIVVLDLWGTWCSPCRESIPRLIDLYRKYEPGGLAVVGLTYEKSDPSDPQTRETVKKFVQQAGIPYPILIGDEPTLKQVPNFKGFPTSMVLDRDGKVRLLITENNANTQDVIEDAVLVLLNEPAKPAPAAAKP
jgi:thiol-disulfide isomerase/thioredoxin